MTKISSEEDGPSGNSATVPDTCSPTWSLATLAGCHTTEQNSLAV